MDIQPNFQNYPQPPPPPPPLQSCLYTGFIERRADFPCIGFNIMVKIAMVDACIALPLPSVILLKLVIIDINYITILQYYLIQEEI